MTSQFEYDVGEAPVTTVPFENVADDLLNKNPCIQDDVCKASTTVSYLQGHLKRATGAVVVVVIDLHASFEFESYFDENGELIPDIGKIYLPHICFKPCTDQFQSSCLVLPSSNLRPILSTFFMIRLKNWSCETTGLD